MSMSACDVAALYPIDWPERSYAIVMRRAGRRCECSGECGRPASHLAKDVRCPNRHGEKRRGGKRWQRPVILSLAHLDPDDRSCEDPEQLLAMCEGCHLNYDREQHAAARAAHMAAAKVLARIEREARLGLVPMFELVGDPAEFAEVLT